MGDTTLKRGRHPIRQPSAPPNRYRHITPPHELHGGNASKLPLVESKRSVWIGPLVIAVFADSHAHGGTGGASFGYVP